MAFLISWNIKRNVTKGEEKKKGEKKSALTVPSHPEKSPLQSHFLLACLFFSRGAKLCLRGSHVPVPWLCQPQAARQGWLLGSRAEGMLLAGDVPACGMMAVASPGVWRKEETSWA